MTEKIYNVLVLCTGNSARSVMAEALIGRLGQGRFRAYSAGSYPSGRINSFAVEQVRSINYPTENLRSKSWDEFAAPDAPKMDIIITVCDDAAGEMCPIWPGHPVSAHWGIPDPSHEAGDDAAKRRAFGIAFETLKARVQGMMALPLDELTPDQLKKRLNEIGHWQASAVAP